MELGGNWTTDGSLMMTSLYLDLRSTGNWPPTISESGRSNTTGFAVLSTNHTINMYKVQAVSHQWGSKNSWQP
jgi:hypothetical protein